LAQKNSLHFKKKKEFPWFNPQPPSNAVRKQKKYILEDLFSSVLSQFKKYRTLKNITSLKT